MSTNTDCGCNNRSESYNGCNCSTTEVTTVCKPNPCPPSECACPVYISTDCVNQVRAIFECSNIESGLTLTETLEKLDQYICDKFGEVARYLRIVNIGGGVELYKGQNGIGEKVFRTLDATSDIITITQAADTVEVGIDEPELINFIVENTPSINYDAQSLGTGADVFKEEASNVFKFRSIKSSDSSVIIEEEADEINLKIIDNNTTYTAGTGLDLIGTEFSHEDTSSVTDLAPTARTYVKSLTFDTFGHVQSYTTGTESDIIVDGSETKVQAGTGATVTGTGTAANPYIVSVPSATPPDGSETKLQASTNVTITGTGTTANPYVISSTDTTYSVGPGLVLSGTTFNVENLQKVITASYTLTDADDNFTIIVNSSSAITITIPSGLKSKINIGFIQKGTGDVQFTGGSLVTLHTALGDKIKGQYYQAYLEQEGSTNEYFLLGNTKL